MAAASFTAAGRRLLSAAAAEKTKDPVPMAQLRRLARAGLLADIDAVLAPLLPSHTVSALSALSAVGLPDRASALLRTVVSPSAEHLNAVISPLLHRRRLAALVPSILAEHASVPRNSATDCILAKSLCLTSGADSALHLLREPPSGEAPSIHLFTALIDSFYKQCLPHHAEELWRAMVQDHGIAPDTAAYNARITYKCAIGTVDEVKELIRVMREARLQPDIFSYNALMRVLSRHKRVDEVVEVYRSMEAVEVADVAPDFVTYSCVVGALCRAGRWSEAENLFYEAVKRRKLAGLGTVRMLVRGLKGAGKGHAARQVVVSLRKTFPDRLNGPWRELEEVAGLPASGKEDEDEVEVEEDDADKQLGISSSRWSEMPG